MYWWVVRSQEIRGRGGLSRSGSEVMDDFYTTFLRTLPRDEWGHPVLPTPEKIRRREYPLGCWSCRSNW